MGWADAREPREGVGKRPLELALARGRFDEARTELDQAVSIYLASVEPDYLPLGRARFALARALTGDRERTSPEARTLAEAALLSFRANRKHGDARRVETWLAEHPTDY